MHAQGASPNQGGEGRWVNSRAGGVRLGTRERTLWCGTLRATGASAEAAQDSCILEGTEYNNSLIRPCPTAVHSKAGSAQAG